MRTRYRATVSHFPTREHGNRVEVYLTRVYERIEYTGIFFVSDMTRVERVPTGPVSNCSATGSRRGKTQSYRNSDANTVGETTSDEAAE